MNALTPPPAEIILVDGGSDDCSIARAQTLGYTVIQSDMRGRAAQINAGIARVKSDLVCVVHADSKLPGDAISIIGNVMSNPKTSLGGFTAILSNGKKIRWGTSFHNWIKTWYAPLFFRPILFLRGGRLLFGDHAMFFRRQDFLDIGGCDHTLLVMEDADLCMRMVRKGKIRLVNRLTYTSDRRVAAWGGIKANFIYLAVGIIWGVGAKRVVSRFYPDIRRED